MHSAERLTVKRWAAVRVRPSALQGRVRHRCALSHAQFSTDRPGTLEKCRTLFVTSVHRSETACAAIRTSNSPIGVPRSGRSILFATYLSSKIDLASQGFENLGRYFFLGQNAASASGPDGHLDELTVVHRVEASCRPIVKRMDQLAEFVGADLIATPARESNFDCVQFTSKFPLVRERREFLDNLSSCFLRVVAHGFLRLSNVLPLSCGRAPQATGRQLQRLVRPLHRRSHCPVWPHPALRTVTEVHVHECLVWQGHLAR